MRSGDGDMHHPLITVKVALSFELLLKPRQAGKNNEDMMERCFYEQNAELQ